MFKKYNLKLKKKVKKVKRNRAQASERASAQANLNREPFCNECENAL